VEEKAQATFEGDIESYINIVVTSCQRGVSFLNTVFILKSTPMAYNKLKDKRHRGHHRNLNLHPPGAGTPF
jgi:hypothetical protein